MKHIAAIVMAVTTVVSLAEPTCREAAIENWSPEDLANLKGTTVVVEGILWGSGWPGLGERVVLATGQRLYFTGTTTGDSVADGNPARIHGKLSLRHWRARKRKEPGYRNGFDYWTIDDPVVEAIARVTSDNVVKYPEPLDKNKPTQTERAGQPAADKPSKIPEYLLPFAYNPDLPKSRFERFVGGGGYSLDGSIHGSNSVDGHFLIIGYDSRELKIDFIHENGKKFSFQIDSYLWPTSGNSALVRVAVFRSPSDEILLAVGGIPVAIIYTKDMRARVVGYNGDNKGKILTPESLAVFDKMTPNTPHAEQPGAGQPATQPADKPPVKDQPSTPTPKDAPR